MHFFRCLIIKDQTKKLRKRERKIERQSERIGKRECATHIELSKKWMDCTTWTIFPTAALTFFTPRHDYGFPPFPADKSRRIHYMERRWHWLAASVLHPILP